MKDEKLILALLIMASVTYIIRLLPLTFFRRRIKSPYIRSFLNFVPFAVLGAMTFPDVFTSTGSVYSAIAGTIVALILAYKNKGIVTCSCSAILVVYLVESFLI